MVWLWVSMLGSPPHVRGKARRVCVDTAGSRITPAHAGKSSQNEICWRRPWDHPHMCGEKGVYAMLYTGLWGSPPRMRGKVLSQSSGDTREWDYPRTCGEKVSSTSPMKCLKGSPPRMRGKVQLLPVHHDKVGITPACAGKRSDPSPAAVPAGLAGSCPASRPSQFPPRMTVISPRP